MYHNVNHITIQCLNIIQTIVFTLQVPTEKETKLFASHITHIIDKWLPNEVGE